MIHVLTEKCLYKLPVGRFVKFDETKDMDGNPRKVVLWAFLDNHDIRHAYFCVETGEYLGDTRDTFHLERE